MLYVTVLILLDYNTFLDEKETLMSNEKVKTISTKELVEELKAREDVTSTIIKPNISLKSEVARPATVLIIWK